MESQAREATSMLRVMAVAAIYFFLSLPLFALGANAAPPGTARDIYIVVLREFSPAARRGNSLCAQHDALLHTVGASEPLQAYTHALNGFAARLTAQQATQLRRNPQVLAVVRNELRRLDTLTTPAFVGLTASNGGWDQLGGGARAGEGVVVAVIDSGIWPEHPSFAAQAGQAGASPRWSGVCQPGDEFPADSCNAKLVGARWFNAGFGGDAAIRSLFPYEFISPRAAEGHGVHTAGTAVGSYRVRAEAGGSVLGRISGMAPGAQLAVYKACWGYGDDPQAGCTTADSVAAIDQAVADGADIINFSVSGSRTDGVDPVELAFLMAAHAGVFVATSAGNAGRAGAATVAHNSPWLATVAMGTHDRRYSAAVEFADGTRFQGVSLHGSGVGNRHIVMASGVAHPGGDAASAALCLPDTLDPALVVGNIIVCARGENARTEKSQVVAAAGGRGMVLVNTAPGTLDADIHAIPTVHLNEAIGAALARHLAVSPNARARLTPGIVITGADVAAPDVAADSSRGPALAGGGDLLKPDLLAPGIPILAAYSPVRTGRQFELLAGTSMSSAHVAGIAALLRQRHPDWSPAAIRSALMTTAVSLRNDGRRIRNAGDGRPADPFAYGAGFVQASAALDPGLVYDAGLANWQAYLCGTGAACFTASSKVDPSNLNQPSIAIGALVGRQTVRRHVRNVGTRRATYRAHVDAPAGIRVAVQPASFTIEPGASKGFRVEFTREKATLDRYAFGSLRWSDGEHEVLSPIAIRPMALAAPPLVSGDGTLIRYGIRFGYSGPFRAMARGPVAAHQYARSVADDPANDINTALSTGVGVALVEISIPTHRAHLRLSLLDDPAAGADELDLYLFDPAGNFVAGSTNTGSAEEIDVSSPTAGRYLAVIHGFETQGASARFTLFSWALPETASQRMTVAAPVRAVLNRDEVVQLGFTGLKKGTRYLGAVVYEGSPGLAGATLVRVDR